MFLAPARAENMACFRYPGDPLQSDQIRLIELLPGAWGDSIRCRLFPIQYKSAKYQTLSYVWGSTKATRLIFVNNEPYRTTINLESALRHLRAQTHKGMVLWVDALCINQDDTEERTQQVKLMGDIYKTCTKVVVYLGENLNGTPRSDKHPPEPIKLDESSSELMEGAIPTKREVSAQKFNVYRVFCLLKNMSLSKHLHELPGLWLEQDLEAGTAILPELDQKDQKSPGCHERSDRMQQRMHLIESLRRFMHPPFTPWWNRIWVIQEIAAPRQVDIAYGMYSAPWDLLAMAAEQYLRHSTSCCSGHVATLPSDQVKVLDDAAKRIMDINELRENKDLRPPELSSSGAGSESLLDLLRKFRDRKASDPRDKIYALLSLVVAQDSSAVLPMIPDYSQSEVEVFCRATLQCIYTSRSLSLFSTDLGQKFRIDLPSWVPDWSAPGSHMDSVRTEAVELYDASPTDRVIEDLIHPVGVTGLRCRACDFDKVQQIGDIMLAADTDLCRKTLAQWWRIIRDTVAYEKYEIISRHEGGYIRTKSRLEFTGFWKLICADVVGDRRTNLVDEVRFVEWACQSRRSPFERISAGYEYGVWSKYGKVYRLIRTMWPDWSTLDPPAVFAAQNIQDDPLEYLDGDERKKQSRRKRKLDRACKPTGMSGVRGMSEEQQELLGYGRQNAIAYLLRFADDKKTTMEQLINDRRQFRDGPWFDLCVRLQEQLSMTHFRPDRSMLRDAKNEVSIVDDSVLTATLSRRLIVGDNYIGLGPANTKVGDELFFIEGGKTPFVLRSRSQCRQMKYEIVGDCYVQDMMDNGAAKSLSEWKDILLV